MLVYNRTRGNRRKMLLLPLLALVLIAPMMLAMTLGLSAFMARQAGQKATALLDRMNAGRPSFLEEPRGLPPGNTAETPDPDAELRFAIATAASGALILTPCILLWGFFSSQTPKLLGVYGARPAGEEPQRILENLCIGAGLPKPRLFVIESVSPNAFAMGLDPAHSIIGVTRGLLDLLDRLELEGVLAHELSHIGNRDTRLNAAVAAVTLFLRLPSLLRQRRHSIQEQTSLGTDMLAPVNPFGKLLFLLLSPVFLYLFLLAPLAGALIRSAISREREFLADADAALLTRFPEGLIRALAKIKGAGSCVGTSPAVAHFYFAETVTPEAAVFDSHPPVDQRIARLVEIHGEVAPAIIDEAVQAGAAFSRRHPGAAGMPPGEPILQDELSALNMGNVMGRVYRVITPATLYNQPDARSAVLAQITAGSLLVVFDDPGRFRQALTAKQVFGYIPLSVRLEQTDLLPAEILEPTTPQSPGTPA